MKKHASNLRLGTAFLLPAFLGWLAASSSFAGSATWLQNPTDNDWSNPSNWTPSSVPNATTDTATFGTSDTATISIAAPIDLASVTFAAGARAYSITVANNQELNLFGSPNIINNSGVEQNFIAEGEVFFKFLAAMRLSTRRSISTSSGAIAHAETAHFGSKAVISTSEPRAWTLKEATATASTARMGFSSSAPTPVRPPSPCTGA